MLNPTVSIILPTYNRLRYIPDAVASILAQTFCDWELLIADDGSDETTQSYLKSLIDPPRIRLLELTHTGRPAVVRNAALREARGDYIAFMDSDDIWMPTKLEAQMVVMLADVSCEWSHTQFLFLDAEGTPTRRMAAAQGSILKQLLEAKTVIALPSVVTSRRLLERVGGFDESLAMCEDYDLWLRLASRTPVVAIHEPLTGVRRHHDHYGNSRAALEDGLRVIDKWLKSAVDADCRAVAREARATYAAMLARYYSASGHRWQGIFLLIQTVPAAWRSRRWWRVALAAAAALLPARALRLVRRRRASAPPRNAP